MMIPKTFSIIYILLVKYQINVHKLKDNDNLHMYAYMAYLKQHLNNVYWVLLTGVKLLPFSQTTFNNENFTTANIYFRWESIRKLHNSEIVATQICPANSEIVATQICPANSEIVAMQICPANSEIVATQIISRIQ